MADRFCNLTYVERRELFGAKPASTLAAIEKGIFRRSLCLNSNPPTKSRTPRYERWLSKMVSFTPAIIF